MSKQNIYKEEAERLWNLLDDISTYGDMFKPVTGYFKVVNKKCEARHGVITSNGYDLTWEIQEAKRKEVKSEKT